MLCTHCTELRLIQYCLYSYTARSQRLHCHWDTYKGIHNTVVTSSRHFEACSPACSPDQTITNILPRRKLKCIQPLPGHGQRIAHMAHFAMLNSCFAGPAVAASAEGTS